MGSVAVAICPFFLRQRGCRFSAAVPLNFLSSDQGKGGAENLLDGGPVNREGVGAEF